MFRLASFYLPRLIYKTPSPKLYANFGGNVNQDKEDCGATVLHSEGLPFTVVEHRYPRAHLEIDGFLDEKELPRCVP